MRKNIFLLVVLLLIVTSVATLFLLNKTSEITNQPVLILPTSAPTDLVTQEITHQFADKYDKAIEDVNITVDINNGEFAKGKVRFENELGGAIWFGAKVEDGWKLAADWQGPMSCETAETYQFPNEIVPACIDQEGNLVTR